MTVTWWKRHKKHKDFVGIEVRENGIAVAHRQDLADGPMLTHVDYIEIGDINAFSEPLGELVKKRGLQKKPCNIVLDPSRYQLLLIDAPEVPDEELRDAIRWRLKDLLSFPVENAAIDIFDLPSDSNIANKRMIYVAVTELELLRQIIEGISKAELDLKSIDISEMALRNIAIHLIDPRFDGRGVAVARIRQNRGSISLFKKGNLYLSRQFDLDYNGGLLDDLPCEPLALELQRSLDYYERQMSQAAPGVIYVCGDNVSENKITPQLQEILMPFVQYLDVSAAMRISQDFDSGLLQLCLVAAGGSLRQNQYLLPEETGEAARAAS